MQAAAFFWSTAGHSLARDWRSPSKAFFSCPTPLTAKKIPPRQHSTGENLFLSVFGTKIVCGKNIPLIVYLLPFPKTIEHDEPQLEWINPKYAFSLHRNKDGNSAEHFQFPERDLMVSYGLRWKSLRYQAGECGGSEVKCDSTPDPQVNF